MPRPRLGPGPRLPQAGWARSPSPSPASRPAASPSTSSVRFSLAKGLYLHKNRHMVSPDSGSSGPPDRTACRGPPHGEGLAGQHPVVDHRGEQLLLAHGGQQEAYGARLGGQAAHHVRPVDVVHLAPGWERRYSSRKRCKVPTGSWAEGWGPTRFPLLPGHPGQLVALQMVRPAAAWIESGKGVQKRIWIRPKHHPVDGLELQGIVMEVVQLHQGVPGGQAVPLLRRGQSFFCRS